MKEENIEIKNENTSIKTVELKRPVEYNGVTYDKLEFNFDSLSGADLLNIGDELRSQGKVTVSPIASSPFLAATAIRACTAPIGTDIYDLLSFYDAAKIEQMTRNFMLGVD